MFHFQMFRMKTLSAGILCVLLCLLCQETAVRSEMSSEPSIAKQAIQEAIKLDSNVKSASSVTSNNGVVYEDSTFQLPKLTGPQLAALMTEGTRVVRGADWDWNNQDGTPPGPGTVLGKGGDGWIRVRWDNGHINSYRMGHNGKYDLYLAESGQRTPCNVLELDIANAEYAGCNENITKPYGQGVEIRCNPGFTLIGPSLVQCEENSTWSNETKCIRSCSKVLLPNAYIFELPNKDTSFPSFGNFSISSIYTEGAQVVYACHENYVTFQDSGRTHSKIVCGPDGKWHPENGGCTRKLSEADLTEIRVDRGTSISLPCEFDKNYNESRADYFWLKNSVHVNNNSVEFTVNSNGMLTVMKMEENTEGHYSCFATKPYIMPSQVTYKLKLKPLICPVIVNEPEFYTLKEGLTAVLKCPHTAKEFRFLWYKNGQFLDMTKDKKLLPDGVLFISSVRDSDKGNYTCQMIDRESGCKRDHLVTVKVISSSASICGVPDEQFPHPWLASLWQADEIAPFCYGAVIHENWIITSAHCLVDYHRKRTINLFVQLNIDGETENTALAIPVKSVKIHPQFLKKQYANDIGLVELSEPVPFRRSIKPICLREAPIGVNQRCSREKIVVVGWGPLANENHNPHAVLEEAMNFYSGYCGNKDDSHVCVIKDPNTGTTMAGHSGSPFEILIDGKLHLLGIYSWGYRLTLDGNVDYFTNITHYIPWINNYILGIENHV